MLSIVATSSICCARDLRRRRSEWSPTGVRRGYASLSTEGKRINGLVSQGFCHKIIRALSGHQSEHRGAVLAQLAGPDPGDRQQVGRRARLTFREGHQGRVGEYDVRRDF